MSEDEVKTNQQNVSVHHPLSASLNNTIRRLHVNIRDKSLYTRARACVCVRARACARSAALKRRRLEFVLIACDVFWQRSYMRRRQFTAAARCTVGSAYGRVINCKMLVSINDVEQPVGRHFQPFSSSTMH
jgi:hypothetical protein